MSLNLPTGSPLCPRSNWGGIFAAAGLLQTAGLGVRHCSPLALDGTRVTGMQCPRFHGKLLPA